MTEFFPDAFVLPEGLDVPMYKIERAVRWFAGWLHKVATAETLEELFRLCDELDKKCDVDASMALVYPARTLSVGELPPSGEMLEVLWHVLRKQAPRVIVLEMHALATLLRALKRADDSGPEIFFVAVAPCECHAQNTPWLKRDADLLLPRGSDHEVGLEDLSALLRPDDVVAISAESTNTATYLHYLEERRLRLIVAGSVEDWLPPFLLPSASERFLAHQEGKEGLYSARTQENMHRIARSWDGFLLSCRPGATCATGLSLLEYRPAGAAEWGVDAAAARPDPGEDETPWRALVLPRRKSGLARIELSTRIAQDSIRRPKSEEETRELVEGIERSLVSISLANSLKGIRHGPWPVLMLRSVEAEVTEAAPAERKVSVFARWIFTAAVPAADLPRLLPEAVRRIEAIVLAAVREQIAR